MASQTLRFPQPTSGSNGQKTILVVANNPGIQELLVSCFTLSGYHCSVMDGEQIASITCRENNVHALADGIVLDVDFRSEAFSDPFDFVHAFCAPWQTASLSIQLPLLLLTTQSVLSDELQREGYPVEMKPFKPRILLSRLKALMERKQAGCGNVDVSWLALQTRCSKQPTISSFIYGTVHTNCSKPCSD